MTTIKKLINRTLAGTAVCSMLMLSGCNDSFLTETPKDFLSPDNAYLTEQGALQGITALHDRVRAAYYSFGEFGTMNWQSHGSDVGYMGEAPDRNVFYINSYEDATPVARYVVDTWNTGFQIIQWANVLIEKVGLADPSVFKDGQAGKDLYIAEARFFRGFAYRYLVSSYGDIPLLDTPVSSAKADFTRDPAAAIHELMAEDFKFASEHLPDRGREAAPGRITKGPALHYLGEVYLELKKPDLALEALNKLVDNSGYDLMTQRFGTRLSRDVFGSGDAFYDLFGYRNHNLAENREAMWVIQCEPELQGGGQVATAYIFGPRYFDIGLTPDGYQAILGTIFNGVHTGYSDILSRGTANVRGTNLVYHYVWKDNWNVDMRNASHNIIRDYYYDNPASAYHGKKIDFSLYSPARPNAMLDTTKNLFPTHTKFLDPENYFLQPNRAGGGVTHKDWYALRFAESLLLRAEANLAAGQAERALQDINRVRSRSKAKPATLDQLNIDYILDERVRELYGEEWRLVTLRRVGKLLERTLKYNDNPMIPGARMQPHNVVWPIPQAQIDLNIDAPFAQNPNY